jgi:uncharacterized membrane protein
MKTFLLSLTLLVAVLAAAAAGGGSSALAFFGLGDDHETLALAGGEVRIPAAAAADGAARFYSVALDGVEVSFFVLTTPDGVTRTAFDACDVCFAAKKGYEQDGPDMICKNCGLRFRGDLVGEVKGGCNPSPLAHAVQDGMLVISETALRAGLPLFPGDRK